MPTSQWSVSRSYYWSEQVEYLSNLKVLSTRTNSLVFSISTTGWGHRALLVPNRLQGLTKATHPPPHQRCWERQMEDWVFWGQLASFCEAHCLYSSGPGPKFYSNPVSNAVSPKSSFSFSLCVVPSFKSCFQETCTHVCGYVCVHKREKPLKKKKSLYQWVWKSRNFGVSCDY